MKTKAKYDRVKIRPSKSKGKKYDAVFSAKDAKTGKTKTKTVSFGAAGMSDFTKHRDEERKRRYIRRHRANENWRDAYSAGALSRYVLWNKPTLSASIKDYKRRFGFERKKRKEGK